MASLTRLRVHNYAPEHLLRAVRFLEQHDDQPEFAALVGTTYPLAEIDIALRQAASGEATRIAIRPPSRVVKQV